MLFAALNRALVPVANTVANAVRAASGRRVDPGAGRLS
jgi:hypothetical protein